MDCGELDCIKQGTSQAVVCEGWGPATLIPPNVSSQRVTERKNRRAKKEREEGGGLHLRITIIRDERRHPSEQRHECRPSQEAGGATEDRGEFLQDKGVKGSGRPDGVLRHALL